MIFFTNAVYSGSCSCICNISARLSAFDVLEDVLALPVAANLIFILSFFLFFLHVLLGPCATSQLFSDGKACTGKLFMNGLECERLAAGLLGVVVTLSSVMT